MHSALQRRSEVPPGIIINLLLEPWAYANPALGNAASKEEPTRLQ